MRVAQGATWVWEANVSDGLGVPIDAVGLQLIVTDPDDGTVTGYPVTEPAIVHTGTGKYEYSWAVPVDADLGVYNAAWSGTVDGLALYGTDSVEVVLEGSISVGTYTYDVSTDAGKVRLLAQDFDMANPIFTDAEIQAFLDLNSGSIRYAAAQALRVIAASEAYILKKVTTLGLSQDGPAVAEALRKLAVDLTAEEDAGVLADWAEWAVDEFSAREALDNALLRGTI